MQIVSADDNLHQTTKLEKKENIINRYLLEMTIWNPGKK